MAYGTKYYYDFADVRQVKYRVNLKKKDYTDATTELIAGAVPFVQDIQQDGRFDEVAATVFDLQVITQTDFNLLSIYTSDSREWMVELLKIADPIEDSTLSWAGWIEGLKGGERLKGGSQTLEITASCGLGQLRNEPYQNEDGTPYTGITTKRDVIKTILSKTGLGLPYGICSNWINAGDGSYSTTGVKITNDVYYEQDGTPLNCLEVLKDILGQLNCEIFQERGIWWIRDISLMKEASYQYYVYNADGTFNSTVTFTNTKLQLGSSFKSTRDSMYSALPPVKRFEASLKLGRYKNQLPNGDFTQTPRIDLPQWTNTLYSTEVGGTGTATDRVYVRINDPMRSMGDIKQSNLIAWANMLIDLNESLSSTAVTIGNTDLDVWKFSGWINASGTAVAVALQFQVITNYGNYYLKQDGSFGGPEMQYKTDSYFEYYPDFVKQAGATRVGVPTWTEITQELDLSFFKKTIEINNRGPRDNPSPFALQGIKIFVLRPSVRDPQALDGQYVKISNFRLVKRKQRELAAQVHNVENNVKTSERVQSFEFYTGDHFDSSELATTYFGNGTTPTSTHTWTNPITSQTGVILQLMLTERAKQYARAYLRIEGQIEGREYDTDFEYSRICEVSGFDTRIFKQVRRRYNVQQKSIEGELQEII